MSDKLTPSNPDALRRFGRMAALFAVVLLTLILIALCVKIEIENAHFDTFFPRRYEFRGARHLYPFVPNRFHDAEDWHDWQRMLNGDENWPGRHLTPNELQEAQRWGQDAPRWTQFVHLVRHGAPNQVFLILAIWLIGWRLFRWVKLPRHPLAWWSLSTCIMIAALIAMNLVYRGYFSAFTDSY